MKIMAVDFGEARTGLACCDKTEYLASPVGVITEKNFSRVVAMTAAAITEYAAEMVVVGHPINMNGTLGERAQRCADFAKALEAAVTVPVVLWDERGSTKTATHYMNETDTRGKKRKQTIDSAAAAIILQSFLDYRKNNPKTI